jgi:hypothetical protein
MTLDHPPGDQVRETDPHTLHRRERQRRYRRRQRNGDIVVTITFRPDETARLNRVGCLELSKLENRSAIADAIHLLIAHILDA